MRSLAVVLAVTAFAAARLQATQSGGPYAITHTYALGGDGGWDYIVPDPPNHRLFIGRQDRVMVVDENSGHAARRGHRHQGRARHGDRPVGRARLRDVRRRCRRS